MTSISESVSTKKNFNYWKNKIIFASVSFFALQHLYFIVLYGINFPYSVDSVGISYLADFIKGGDFPLEELLIGTHSGHIIFFPRLIALPNFILNSFDVLNIFYLQWIIISIFLFFVYLLLKKTDQRVLWTLIPIAAFVYSPLINSNYFSFATLLWQLPSLGIIIVIYSLREKTNFKFLTASIGAAIFSTFSSIIGIVAWVPAFLYMFKNNFKKKWAVIWIASMISIGIFYNVIVPQLEVDKDFMILFSFEGLSFIATFLSTPFRVKFDILMNAIGFATIFISFFCVYYFTSQKKIQNIIPWLSFLLVGFSGAIIVAIGRASLEFHHGNEPYYITISQFTQIGLLVLISLIILDIKSSTKNTKKNILLVILISIIVSQMILLVPSYYAGWLRGDYYLNEKLEYASCYSLYHGANCVDDFENTDQNTIDHNVMMNIWLEKKFSMFGNDKFNQQNEKFIEKYSQEMVVDNEKFFGIGKIETINGIQVSETVSISLEKPALVIEGWALDQNMKQLDNLYLLLDGEPFLKYDDFLTRTNIVEKNNLSSLIKPGWKISFLSGYLENGCYEISLGSLKEKQIINFEQKIEICKK